MVVSDRCTGRGKGGVAPFSNIQITDINGFSGLYLISAASANSVRLVATASRHSMMELNTSLQQLDTFLIHRLLRRSAIEKIVTTLKMVFVLLTCGALVLLASVFIEEYLSVQSASDMMAGKVSEIISTTDTADTLRTKQENYSIIYEKSVFGEVKKTAVPEPKAVEKPKSKAPLTLVGTFVGPDSEAIIEDSKQKEQDVFSVGDTIFDDATLVKVLTDRVEIKRDGKIEILTLDDGSGLGGDTTSGGESDESFTVDESELDNALENLPLLLTQARAVPYFKDGKAIGLRLFAIKNGSLYEKVGLRNGDILKSLNGNSLGDISQAMKLFERLKEERNISLQLERNRVTKTFRYTIR